MCVCVCVCCHWNTSHDLLIVCAFHLISVGIFGGSLLGIRSSNRLSFYDWESLELIRRIEISAKLVRTSYNQYIELGIIV